MRDDIRICVYTRAYRRVSMRKTAMTFRSVVRFFPIDQRFDHAISRAAQVGLRPWLQAEASSRMTAARLFEFHHGAKLSG